MDTQAQASAPMEMAFKAKGVMTAILRDKDGNEKLTEKQNLVVTSGINFICDALAKASSRPGVLSHIAVGTGVAAAAAGDTALGTEIGRGAATYAHTSGVSSFTMAVTFAAGTATGNITEAGLLNASSGGTLFNRVVFSAIPKESTDTLDITFTITFTPA